MGLMAHIPTWTTARCKLTTARCKLTEMKAYGRVDSRTEHPSVPLFWMYDPRTPGAHGVCLSYQKPLILQGLLSPSPGGCQPSFSSVERDPHHPLLQCREILSALPFLNASLDSLICFLSYSTSFVGFSSI